MMMDGLRTRKYNYLLLKVSVSVTDIITGSDPVSSGLSWLL